MHEKCVEVGVEEIKQMIPVRMKRVHTSSMTARELPLKT